jgi:uracil phosphoribosyltransferase
VVAVNALTVVEHPVVADKVRELRDKRTSNADFLRLAGDISRFVAYEAVPRGADRRHHRGHARGRWCGGRQARPGVRHCSYLASRLGMSPAVQSVLPRHRVCLVGLRRNEETLQPDVYLDGLPEDLTSAPVVLCDPMLATGGSLIRVVDMLKSRRAGEITVLCLIAAQPGVDALLAHHGDVRIVAAALDERLTEIGYIAPDSATPGTDSSARPFTRFVSRTYLAEIGTQQWDLPIVSLNDDLAVALLITVDVGVDALADAATELAEIVAPYRPDVLVTVATMGIPVALR